MTRHIAQSKGKYYMWGFIDETGGEVIEPRFDRADVFSEGLCSVELAGRELCIDRSGHTVIGGDFDVGRFQNGVAYIKMGGLFGLIDHHANLVIPPKYSRVITAFREGLSHMRIGDLYGYINITGAIVIDPKFKFAEAFSHGLAAVKFPHSLERWYVNHAGEPVLGPYRRAAEFHDGIALVTDNVGRAYIDTQGNVRYRFDRRIEPFSEFNTGLAPAFRLDDAGQRLGMGYINKSGEWVIDPKYDHAHAFGENGLAQIEKHSRFGLIDPSGNVVVPLEYETMDLWSGPYIVVTKGGKAGFIDRNNNVVIDFRYESALPFSEGLAAVRVSR